MIQLPVQITGVVVCAYAFCPYLVPLLIANSITGLVYMHLEREALKSKGTFFLTHNVKLDFRINLLTNILFHLVVPIALVGKYGARCTPFPFIVTVAECIALRLFHVDRLYPTQAYSLRHYKTVHLLIVLAIDSACAALSVKER